MKYFSKYRRQIIGSFGLSLFIILAAAGCILYLKVQKKDNLVGRMPLETMLYVSLRQPVWPEPEISAADSPIAYYLPELADKFGIDEDILAEAVSRSERTSVAAIGSGTDIGLLLYFLSLENDFPKDSLLKLPNSMEDGRMVVIASSPQALKTAKDTLNGKLYSLTDRTDFGGIGTERVNLYINLNELRKYIADLPPAADDLFANYLGSEICASGKYAPSGWEFEIANILRMPQDRTEAVIKSMPADAKLLVSGFSVGDFFNQQVGAANGIGENPLQRLIAIHRLVNSTSTGELEVSLIGRSGDWLLFPASEPNAFGFDFVAAYSGASADIVAKLQSFIQTVLAVYYPGEADYLLPDNTKVTEYYAQPDTWDWKTVEDERIGSIFVINEPKNGGILAIFHDNSDLYITNSIDRLADLKLQNNNEISDYLAKKTNNSYLIYNNLQPTTSTRKYLQPSVIGIQFIDNKIIAKFSLK